MHAMRRHTPSLSCLLAFEASARHLSFTRAGDDLCVTQGAISKLVKALEEELGVLMFVREGKKLTMTAAAEIYLQRIQPSLAKLEAASLELKAGGRSSGRMNLAVLPSIAARWLMPRYSDFSARHPDVILNLTTHLSPFNFQVEDIDAAIHFGASASWSQAQMDFLLEDAVVPICSPDFMQRYGPFERPEQLLEFTFLHLASRTGSWHHWFSTLGVATERGLPGPVFEHYMMIIQVVTAGLGIGLAPYFLVAEDIAHGRLKVPYHHVAGEDLAYYLVYPPHKRDHRPLVAFRDWLTEQLVHTRAAIDAFRAGDVAPSQAEVLR